MGLTKDVFRYLMLHANKDHPDTGGYLNEMPAMEGFPKISLPKTGFRGGQLHIHPEIPSQPLGWAAKHTPLAELTDLMGKDRWTPQKITNHGEGGIQIEPRTGSNNLQRAFKDVVRKFKFGVGLNSILPFLPMLLHPQRTAEEIQDQIHPPSPDRV